MTAILSIIFTLQEVFLTWAFNNFPVVGLFIFTVWSTWNIRGKLDKFEHRVQRIEEKLDEVVRSVKELKADFNELKADFRTIVVELIRKKIIKPKFLRRR